MNMPSLLLQKHDHKVKEIENRAHLKRRLELWKQGKVNNLLFECKSIQDRLPSYTQSSKNQDDVNKKFTNLMKHGKINAALNLLSEITSDGVLPLNETTMQQLEIKHPPASPEL